MDDLILKCFIHAHSSIIFGLIFAGLFMNGTFGVTDEMKSVSVMEGDSVTLHTNATEIQKAELITWTFGSDRTRIAQINRSNNKVSLYDDALDGRFRDRLKLDDQTGSLTITNTTTEHTGLYEQQTFGGDEAPPQRFSVTVFAPLPIPVIMRNCSLSSACSVVCSVVNVSHVTLSWLKGNSLLSSISVSDFSISLSLPLEVEDQEKNTYSCEINNPIRHQTTHLDISAVCQPCEVLRTEEGLPVSQVLLICISVVLFLLVAPGIIYWRKRHRLGHNNIYMKSDGDALNESAVMKMVSVNVGETVTLNTGVTEIKRFDMLQWGFGEMNTDKTNPFIIVARTSSTGRGRKKSINDNTIQLDRQTGCLIIEDIRPSDFGLYRVDISRIGRNVISKTFIVQDSSENRPNMPEETKTLKNGEISENGCES